VFVTRCSSALGAFTAIKAEETKAATFPPREHFHFDGDAQTFQPN
jgi:hypothetical protein